MNKVRVGNAPPPNLREVRSKIGSLSNTAHKPGGGKVKIENKKLEFNVSSRIAAKNEAYVPGGGEKKVSILDLLICYIVCKILILKHLSFVSIYRYLVQS